jgi:microcystin degradation protein MlrC
MKRNTLAIFPLVMLFALFLYPDAQGSGNEGFLKPGKDSFVFQDEVLNFGRPLTIWTYLPSSYSPKSAILFVMHGNSRNASTYRDQWVEIAERNNALLIVPEFSAKDFPRDTDYNMGRMFEMGPNDVPLAPHPENVWSFSLIEPIFDEVKKRMANESEGYLIYGHSAGAQFVHRYIFFKPEARILKAVCANAGWYTLPDFGTAFPYGLKGARADRESLSKAFKKKVTIYLGEADTSTVDESLRKTPEAMKQGKNRFERGHDFFDKCKAAAQNLNLSLNWDLRIAPGVGHSNARMAVFAEKALFPEKRQPFRIAVATFSHETCTFCPGSTTVEDWEFYGPPTRDILRGETGYIGGFKRFCEEFGGVELVPIISPRDAKGGSSGSWITREAFEKYAGLIVSDLLQSAPLDGVFLALHGAMAVTGIPKPEAELARRVRAAVGNIPIMVSLDLHANEDHELAEAVDAVFIIKRYPHYDTTLIGETAARVMLNTMHGRYKPVMAVRKPGVITPSVFQGTGTSPAMEIMERARIWECEHPGVYVSVAFGFAYADVPDVGATVMVVANNNRKLVKEIAEDMSDFIWRKRKEFAAKKLPKTKEGVALAIRAVKEGKRPVVIADHSDRTGGSTHILEELIRQKAENFCLATLRDENALEALAGRKVGDTVSLELGGYSDEFAGNPVPVEGRIEFIGTPGRERMASIRLGRNNHVIITPQLMQVTSTRIFDRAGLRLEELDIIVLKSRVHFRRGYADTGIAGAIIEVDAPGWGPADLTILPYKNIPKGLYPLDIKE